MNQPGKQAHGVYSTGAPSTAAIFGHPLHPVLVAFPIAFLSGVVLTDFAFWRTADPFWARASLWLVAAGVVTGLLAAVLGFIDFVTIRRVRSHLAGWLHLLGNLIAVGLSAISWFLRARDMVGAVLPTGFVLSLVVGGILLMTGYLGGELAFRYLIGVVTKTGAESDVAANKIERK